MLVRVKRAVLIVNPYSTQVTGQRIGAVEQVLRERVELRTEFTQRPGHATELAAACASEHDAILVFSGDGTYNEALNGADGAVPSPSSAPGASRSVPSTAAGSASRRASGSTPRRSGD
jgi:diacylglycerol kinase family enzyme